MTEVFEDFYFQLSNFLTNDFSLWDSIYEDFTPHISLLKLKNTKSNLKLMETIIQKSHDFSSFTKKIKIRKYQVKIGQRTKELEL